VGFHAIEITVPHIQQSAKKGNVFFRRSIFEMLVHGMRTAEELPKIVKADIQGNREPNRRPHAIPATDQDSNPNMFLASIPNFVTSFSFVESATKCLAIWASSLADLRNHCLAVSALVHVSAVVNVLLAMRNNVVEGSDDLRASAM